jgi:hypothetical protein
MKLTMKPKQLIRMTGQWLEWLVSEYRAVQPTSRNDWLASTEQSNQLVGTTGTSGRGQDDWSASTEQSNQLVRTTGRWLEWLVSEHRAVQPTGQNDWSVVGMTGERAPSSPTNWSEQLVGGRNEWSESTELSNQLVRTTGRWSEWLVSEYRAVQPTGQQQSGWWWSRATRWCDHPEDDHFILLGWSSPQA